MILSFPFFVCLFWPPSTSRLIFTKGELINSGYANNELRRKSCANLCGLYRVAFPEDTCQCDVVCIASGDCCPDFGTFCPQVAAKAAKVSNEASVAVALEAAASLTKASEAEASTTFLETGNVDAVLTKCHALDRVNGVVGIQTVVRCPGRPPKQVRGVVVVIFFFWFLFFFIFAKQ